MATKAMPENGRISLKRVEYQVITVPVVGVTPLIQQKFSEKAKGMMRDKQMGTAVRAKKEAKNPEADAMAATYWIEEGKLAGIPAVAFKAAIVRACKAFDGLAMTDARTLFFVHGIPVEGDVLVPIENCEWQMREDTPRVGMGVADLRYRNQFWPWSATLRIEFAPSLIDAESVLALVEQAGRGGVGEWRPSSPKSNTGIYGQFRIDDTREIAVEAVAGPVIRGLEV